MGIGRVRHRCGRWVTLICACVLTACSAQDEIAPAPPDNVDLQAAEAFIDAFYSWDAQALSKVTKNAPDDQPQALYYQAWAQAGNYAIQTRRPCTFMTEGRIDCPVTVTDDIGGALGYVATDTFQLTLQSGVITAVQFTSDDPPVLDAVFAWMNKARPEVFTGPCKDMFAGGTTPAACVHAVVQGARDFPK